MTWQRKIRMTGNSDFFEAFAASYCDYYRDVDAGEAVRHWTRLLRAAGVNWATNKVDGTNPTLLDLGCGPGWHLGPWGDQGFDVCGLDSSPSMLEIARSHPGNGPPKRLYCANILNPASIGQLNQRFDRIVSHFNFLNLFAPQELDALFDSISTLMAPKGLFAFDYSPKPTISAADDTSGIETIKTEGTERTIVRRWNLSDGTVDEIYWFHDIEQLRRISSRHSLCVLHILNWPLSDNLPGTRNLIIAGKDEP